MHGFVNFSYRQAKLCEDHSCSHIGCKGLKLTTQGARQMLYMSEVDQMGTKKN